MSDIGPEGRSFALIEREDLDRLAAIARADRRQFFAKYPRWAQFYENRHIATALCQGAALHYLRGDVGIQDFDVYSFFAVHPHRRWYAKRNQPADFGDPKFGQSPSHPNYTGRRVDLMARAIRRRGDEPPSESIRHWLREGRTRTSKFLAAKAVVMLEPEADRGEVIWPRDVERR